MNELTLGLLGRATRIFLELAYPDSAIPENRQPFLDLQAGVPLKPLLRPPICQTLSKDGDRPSELEGYAFRLGSADYPNMKLQVVWQERIGSWVFSVDTHDAIHVPESDPDHARFRDLQAKNRRLKQQIEQAWETNGLMTFNASLRQALSLHS